MFEEPAGLLVWLIPIVLLAAIFLLLMVRILREYERGVIFRLGKLLGTKGPGLIFLIPIIDRMVRMDLRIVTIEVPRQELMTRDNVPMTVDAVVYFRVIDPAAAVVRVEQYLKATSLISQTTLRSALGRKTPSGPKHEISRSTVGMLARRICDNRAWRNSLFEQCGRRNRPCDCKLPFPEHR